MRTICGTILAAAMAAGVIGSVNAAVGHDDSCPVSTNIRGHENRAGVPDNKGRSALLYTLLYKLYCI